MERYAAMSDGLKIGEQVIEACRQGDRDAFRQLFEAYKDKVYSVALYFFGGDEAQASDVTQQVFLKLFTKIGQFRYESEFTTWLHRMTANACLDELRARRRFLPFGDAHEATGTRGHRPQEETFDRAEIADGVRAAIGTLKPKLRIAVLLKYFEELSYEEMAAALNCSKGTVASRLNRGHKILARRLGHLRDTLVRGD